MDLKSLIGNTPLVKISDKIYAKLETYNPSGSIKDRMASYILQKAEENGDLRPGYTIVEASSGNTAGNPWLRQRERRGSASRALGSLPIELPNKQADQLPGIAWLRARKPCFT